MINILAISGFNDIRVYHHDTEGAGSDTNMWTGKNMNRYHTNINTLLTYYKNDELYNIPIRSTYNNRPLNFKILEDTVHLIFDFAHLFNYIYIPNSPKSVPFIESLPEEDFSTINVIYLGYLGQNEGNNSRQMNNPGIITNSHIEAITLGSLIQSNFVKINEDGNVSTYIDKISEYSLLKDIMDIRNKAKLQRSTNRSAKTENGSFVSSISISNQPSYENIIINSPEITIRKIAELTYLDEKNIRSKTPFPTTYINDVNDYFVNEFMENIML